MEKIRSISQDDFQQFIFAVFGDCRSFLLQKLNPASFPTMHIKIVYQTEKYRQFEIEEAKESTENEVPKNPSTAFTAGNKFFSKALCRYGKPP
jgi:hypothetical protein